MIVTDELLKEFEETWGHIPDMEVWPHQFKFQYKLFLLEKGYYGTKTQGEEASPGRTNS